MKVGVVDYGVGNLGSMARTLEEVGAQPMLITRPPDLSAADCLILPGVGNFSDCVRLLQAGGWISALRDEVLGNQRRLLGVCVGMQLLAHSSTEGMDGDVPTPGLSLIPGHVEHLRGLGCTHRVPHVGWNSINRTIDDDSLLQGIPDQTDFYFVHSYAFVPSSPEYVLAMVDYGVQVTAIVRKGNVWGTQFHPEKSSRAGFRLLRNFISEPSC